MTNPTAPSDADLIAQLRDEAFRRKSNLIEQAADRFDALLVERDGWKTNCERVQNHLKFLADADRIDALSKRLAEREATIATVKAFADQNRKSTSTARLVIAGDLDPILSAAPGDALSARLAEVERQRDRAEQCIEQVREWRSEWFTNDQLDDIFAAYDAARETPAPAEPEDERG